MIVGNPSREALPPIGGVSSNLESFCGMDFCTLFFLQHTATHCNTLQHTATHCITLSSTLQHTATHCNTLQHTATHCRGVWLWSGFLCPIFSIFSTRIPSTARLLWSGFSVPEPESVEWILVPHFVHFFNNLEKMEKMGHKNPLHRFWYRARARGGKKEREETCHTKVTLHPSMSHVAHIGESYQGSE